MLRSVPKRGGDLQWINARTLTSMACHEPEGAVMRRSIGIRIAALVLLLLGCSSEPKGQHGSKTYGESSSGGDAVPNSAVHASGSNSASGHFGPPGGSLDLASGVKIEIPAGAVDGAMDFVLKEAPMTTAFFNQEHERPVGPTFVFSPGVDAPDGQAIRVSIPLASYPKGWGDVAIGVEIPVGAVVGGDESEHTKWEYEDAKLVGGRAVAELPGLNGYRMQFVLSNLEAQ